jgi:hypothetical protein
MNTDPIDNLAQSFLIGLVLCSALSDGYLFLQNMSKNKNMEYYKDVYQAVTSFSLQKYEEKEDGCIIITDDSIKQEDSKEVENKEIKKEEIKEVEIKEMKKEEIKETKEDEEPKEIPPTPIQMNIEPIVEERKKEKKKSKEIKEYESKYSHKHEKERDKEKEVLKEKREKERMHEKRVR